MPSYPTIMEDDLFGTDGYSIARYSSSVSLDLEGMLEAAEGSLQHQICEFLQRFDGEQAGVVHENLYHSTVHDGCFSIPAPRPPFHFLPGESTLQLDTNTSSVELEPTRQLPENSLHHILNYGSSHIQTKQFTVGERSLPASTRASAPPPRQLWGVDQLQTDRCSRASFQLQHDVKASQRSFVYGGAPGSQASVPSTIPRDLEFPTCASSSCSPTNIPASSMSFQPRLPQKAEDEWSGQERRLEKSKRVPDQAGHIIRERLRRDDMTSKFLMLESLLPPGPKGPLIWNPQCSKSSHRRDRATIVEHSIQHVKNLHHRKKGLQQKRTEMAKACTRAPQSFGRPRLAQKTMAAAMHPSQEMGKKISNLTKDDNNTAKKTTTTAGSFFGGKVEVHFNLPQEIVVEMMCRSHAHFQSRVFEALERLRMDVAQCSLSRARGLVLCSMVLQPREIFDPSVTSDDIARALKRAIYL